jgi:hypothetical protein
MWESRWGMPNTFGWMYYLASSPRAPMLEALVSLLQANHQGWNRFLTNPFDQSES